MYLVYDGYQSINTETIQYIIVCLLSSFTHVCQVYNPQIRADSQVLRPISKHQADLRTERINSNLPGESEHPCSSHPLDIWA